ncbi:MAG: GNAT family N-acetyltransferase, partial [Opitutales bacterium]
MADEPQIVLRHLALEDYPALREAYVRAYAATDNACWTEADLARLLNLFPEGQFGIEVEGTLAAVALAIIVDYPKFGDRHTYKQITGSFTFSTHDPDGDVLYGIEIFVHPDYRGFRLGRRLYDARKELCENLNLRAIVAGGRLPKYEDYSKEMTPRQYIDKVKAREFYDPTLTFQLSNDFQVKRILHNYDPEDSQSRGLATLLEWN